MSTVREAMVSNPGQLPGDSSAQAAGELLQRPEVRAVYVTEDERLVGVVTRKTLVREVVATGLDPTTTELRAIAEAPHFTIGPDVPVEEAFHFLEAQDAERVPVVDEHHRLIGVLSRSVLQRRLAEDEDDVEDDPLPPAA
jgi:CBS domain-containing protein